MEIKAFPGEKPFPEILPKYPILPPPHQWIAQHVYVCDNDATELQQHLLFRDYLRQYPEAAIKYGQLKRQLAHQFRYQRDTYAEAKTDFIMEILRKAHKISPKNNTQKEASQE